MRKLVRWVLFLSLVLFITAPVSASECEDVFFPNEITVGGQTLTLNGLGVREATIFNVNVYVAALWVQTTTTDGQAVIDATGETRRLSLRFVRDVDASDMTDAFAEGFRNNNDDVSGISAEMAQLMGYMEDIEDGERITFTYVPGEGVHVKVKGDEKGVIPGEAFARAFFGIWFGPSPPNSGLKRGLLGGSCG